MDWTLALAALGLGPCTWLLTRFADRHLGNRHLALISIALVPSLGLAALILSRSGPPLGIALLAALASALAAVSSGALVLMGLNQLSLIDFVWPDEHGADGFLALVMVVVGVWGALCGMPGDWQRGLCVALGAPLGCLILDGVMSGVGNLKNRLSAIVFSVLVGGAAVVVGAAVVELSRA